ncbi:MAG: dihydrodipicolinate synthase family protein [Planctomycetota bacterium]|jgi:4-hydroxy-tetrahydrodipicolinate synthase
MSMKPQELRSKIKGVIHLVVTHFDEDDKLDEKAIRKSVDHVADALKGRDAVFLTTASTAEFYAMTDDECKRAIRIVVEEVGGRFPVVAGTGRSGTKWTIEMSQFAQQVGADGVMIVNPYYQPTTTEGLFRHFEQIAAGIDIGRLSKISNIVADKENTVNAVAYYWMQKAVDPEDMVVVCGIGQLMYPFFAVYGCPGFVTEFANFAPRIAIDLYDAAQKRDFDRLAQLSDKTAPYHRFLAELGRKRSVIPTVLSPAVSSDVLPLYQAVIKAAMSLTGLPGGRAREPMENLTDDEKKQLRNILKNMGAL